MVNNTEQEKNIEKETKQINFNLGDEGDLKELEKSLQGDYFKPENDVTYKVVLNSPKVIKVEKVFADGPITKFAIDVTISDKNGEVFNGLWEVGTTILKTIMKKYDKDAVFKVTKTGAGLDTKYNIVADF